MTFKALRDLMPENSSGSPVVRTLYFHCQWVQFLLGKPRSCKFLGAAKTKQNKTRNVSVWQEVLLPTDTSFASLSRHSAGLYFTYLELIETI